MMATTIITTTVITTTKPPPEATIMITTIMLAATTITPIVITTNTGLLTNGSLFNLIPNMKHGNTKCGMTTSTTWMRQTSTGDGCTMKIGGHGVNGTAGVGVDQMDRQSLLLGLGLRS